MTRPLALALLTLALAACRGEGPTAPAPAENVGEADVVDLPEQAILPGEAPALDGRYVCDDESTFEARFLGADSVQIALADLRFALIRTADADGARYSDGEVDFTFRPSGDALVDLGGEAADRTCVRTDG